MLDSVKDPITIPYMLANRDHLIGLILALKYNTKVPKLIFAPYTWQQDELHLLEETLAHNQGVQEIEFEKVGFCSNFTESIVRILKRNKNIKRVFFNLSRLGVDAWARLVKDFQLIKRSDRSLLIANNFLEDH